MFGFDMVDYSMRYGENPRENTTRRENPRQLLTLTQSMILLLVGLMLLPHAAVAQTRIPAPGNSCIIEVPSGSFVTSSTNAIYPDGSTHSYLSQSCTNMVAPFAAKEYLDEISSSNTPQFSSITAQWVVPQTPSNTAGQTIYFFDALEKNDLSVIIQPVLAYGQSSYKCGIFTCYVGGNYWYLASWEAYSDQSAVVSSILNVNVGDQITGSVTWINSGCAGNPGYYLIRSVDNTLNQETDLSPCDLGGQVTLGISAALEAANIGNCNQFPNHGSLDFTSISSGSSPAATWVGFASQEQSPFCGYAVNFMTQVHIHSYPTNDIYTRSHGLSLDQTLPVPWWPPYQSGYVIATTGSAFDYYTTYVFCHHAQPNCVPGNDYVQEAASGSVPSYAWHTQIYINGVLNTEGDVGRNQVLQAGFTDGWTPNLRMFF